MMILYFCGSPKTIFADAESDYQQNKHYMHVNDRLQLVHQIMETSSDIGLVMEALDDYLKFSWSQGKVESALISLEKRINEDGIHMNPKVELTKARLLARAGNLEQANAIFKKAMTSNWDNAYQFYYDSLLETDHYVQLASTIYQDTWNPDYKEKKDFTYFAEIVYRYKLAHPDIDVTSSVFPQLPDLSDYPHAGDLAHAFCLIANKEYSKAVTILQSLENANLTSSDEFYQEKQNIPLYIAFARFLGDIDLNNAIGSLQEFFQRNTDDPNYCIEKAMWIGWQLERSKSNRPKLYDLAHAILDDENLQKAIANLADNKIASLLDMQCTGLAWLKRFEEASVLSLKIMDKYYPHTLAGANVAKNYAIYLAFQQKPNEIQTVEATQLLNDILVRTPYDEVNLSAKRLLAEFQMYKGNYDLAKPDFEDLLEAVEDNPNYKEHQEKILKNLLFMDRFETRLSRIAGRGGKK